MANTLVINKGPRESRVAWLENGSPVEVYVERASGGGVVGNIYRGRVVRVLPGMQAAFVDIGLDRTGFLYVNDALCERPRGDAKGSDDLCESGVSPQSQEEEPPTGGSHEPRRRGFRSPPLANIADLLSAGQEILVQVQKEPLKSKGARLTRQVSIPGRMLVHLPFGDQIGVSHRIEDETERARFKEVLTEQLEQGGGFIVRTAAEGVDAETLQHEVAYLRQTWQEVSERAESGPVPKIVHQELDLILKATRDLFTDAVERVITDDRAEYARLRDFVRGFAPGQEYRVELYQERSPILEHFGVEVEIERALERRVRLKSGGYVVIDQAEALTVVDVNSGRFVGKSSLEDTITHINLEAVKEIAYQLRLRDIGGIIIVDFIDMASARNREKVLDALEAALRRDRAKTTIVRMSEIGLVEMTRKRVRESLGGTLTEACPYCKGRAFIKSRETMANEVLRAVVRTLGRESAATLRVNMNAELVDYLYENGSAEIERIERQHHTRLVLVARPGHHREHYELVLVPGDQDG